MTGTVLGVRKAAQQVVEVRLTGTVLGVRKAAQQVVVVPNWEVVVIETNDLIVLVGVVLVVVLLILLLDIDVYYVFCINTIR